MELRWKQKTIESDGEGKPKMSARRLQFRTILKSFCCDSCHPDEDDKWTEWQDVPTEFAEE